MAETRLSWSPKRIGKAYCSPACGGGCTWLAYQKALRAARGLSKRLGKQWKLHVWENLGWHWDVYHVSGCVRVSRRRAGGDHYVAYVGEGTPDDPISGGRWTGSGVTPESALADVLRRMQVALGRIRIKRMVEAVKLLTPG